MNDLLTLRLKLIMCRPNPPLGILMLGYLLGVGHFDDGLFDWVLSLRHCLVGFGR